VEFTDELFGRIVQRLSVRGELERSWVVVLSDHGYRFGGRERDPLQVPFMVKAPGQRTAAYVREPERAERLLLQTVDAACTARPPRE
jgi:arylsulfatase A-like enzyme